MKTSKKVSALISFDRHAEMKAAAKERRVTIGAIVEFAIGQGMDFLKRHPRAWNKIRPDHRAVELSRKFKAPAKA